MGRNAFFGARGKVSTRGMSIAEIVHMRVTCNLLDLSQKLVHEAISQDIHSFIDQRSIALFEEPLVFNAE